MNRRIAAVALATFGLTGCLSVGDAPPMGPPLLSGATVSSHAQAAVNAIGAQAGSYQAKLKKVGQGELFNLYFSFLGATGGLGSALFDASDGTLKAWAFATGLGTVTDRVGQLKPVHVAYETAIAGFSCVGARAAVFTSPAADGDWAELSEAGVLDQKIRDAEANIAAAVYPTDDAVGKALVALLPPAKIVAARGYAARGALHKAPSTVLDAGRLIDGIAQAAERKAAVDVGALVKAIRALEKEIEPPKGTPSKEEALLAGDTAEAAIAGLTAESTKNLAGDKRLVAIGDISSGTAKVNAVLERVDYVEAARQVAQCAAPTAL